MFVESRYLGDRPPRDRELVDDICEVVSGLDVVSVAVRYPNREVEAFIGSVETAFDGVGNVSRGSAVTVDIAPFGVTKATAVAQLVMASGQRPEHTVVFGDMPSDLPLFAWAGYGIAVANAAQVVKAAAAEITASNDRDGVAHAIAGLLGLPHE
jgi:hydroxymethylpyrimidine pyrophosphatase-like HAD family hydrolase